MSSSSGANFYLHKRKLFSWTNLFAGGYLHKQTTHIPLNLLAVWKIRIIITQIIKQICGLTRLLSQYWIPKSLFTGITHHAHHRICKHQFIFLSHWKHHCHLPYSGSLARTASRNTPSRMWRCTQCSFHLLFRGSRKLVYNNSLHSQICWPPVAGSRKIDITCCDIQSAVIGTWFS